MNIQKKTGKAAKGKTVERRISELDMRGLMKMGVGEFVRLRDSADAAGRKKLDYLMESARIEGVVRTIVREELAKERKR